MSWVDVSELGSQSSDISNGSDCYSISNNSLASRKKSPFPKQYYLSCLTPNGLITKKSQTTSLDIGDIRSQISDATPCTFSSEPRTIINVDFQVDSLLPPGLHLHYLLNIKSHYDVDDKNPFVISCLSIIQHRLKRQHSNYESKTPEFQKELIKSSFFLDNIIWHENEMLHFQEQSLYAMHNDIIRRTSWLALWLSLQPYIKIKCQESAVTFELFAQLWTIYNCHLHTFCSLYGTEPSVLPLYEICTGQLPSFSNFRLPTPAISPHSWLDLSHWLLNFWNDSHISGATLSNWTSFNNYSP